MSSTSDRSAFPYAPRFLVLWSFCFATGATPLYAQAYFDVIHSFDRALEGSGTVTLMQAADGDFYGTASDNAGSGGGTVFRMTSNGAVTVLHAFLSGLPSEGSFPIGRLTQASDGDFYGTTSGGGLANCAFPQGCGTIFKITATGVFTIVHFFDEADGRGPYGGLIQASDGNFYGTTGAGGGANRGTVFTMTPDGTVTVLHSFSGNDGANPAAPLTQATDGNLYGTTSAGGSGCIGLGCGTIFQVTPSGAFSVLHNFEGGLFGENPTGALVQAADGNFYGMTTGSYGAYATSLGTVFRMTPGGIVTTLHAFRGGIDGANPLGSLIEGEAGQFYGAVARGGAFGVGSVFKMTADGSLTVLHAFTGGADGENPLGVQVSAREGSLYGTTTNGTALQHGGVFRVSQTPSIDRSFTADFDGDGRSDLVVFRPSTAQWLISYSSTNYATWSVFQWGARDDVPLVADFDGDRKSDLVVFRPTTAQWFISYSSTNYATWSVFQWGVWNDVPLAADFDGDGKTDLVVWRPSTAEWFVLYSSSHYTSWTSFQWGIAGDIPLVTDFDGDGRTDLAVYRPGNAGWYVRTSSSKYTAWGFYQWGIVGDVPLVGDFDGDGKADLTVWRPSTGTWYIRFSSSGYAGWTSYQWGGPGDALIQADFDGDRQTDLVVWRPTEGAWYMRLSSRGFSIANALRYFWGVLSDAPL